MKLNLLPATVSRGAQIKTAVAISVVFAILGFVVAILLTITSRGNLQAARDDYVAQQQPAARAVATAASANELMSRPEVQNLVTDVSLAEAMMRHNDAYPDLYNSLRPYIPPYFRLTRISAAPLSDTQSTVTMTGTLKTFQQYADLMLSLMLYKDAVSVSRSGFTNDEMIVPQLVSTDQNGRPRKPNETPVPDDPLERLAYFQNQPKPAGYQGIGNYGSGTDLPRGAMPDESLVTVQMVVNRPLQTPNPQATITSRGGGGGVPGPGGGGMPGAAPGMMPGAPGGGAAPGRMPGMPGRPGGAN
jgi:Tfp pilus assembly protein PilN